MAERIGPSQPEVPLRPAFGSAAAGVSIPTLDRPRRARAVHAALYAVFLLSGAAGLTYESIWTRYLSLFVGSAAYAQVLVITIFFGGMAAGAMIVGRRSDSLRLPLAWYAAAELLLGLFGLAFHRAFVATTVVAYDSLFPALSGSPALLLVVKWGLAALLILPQSVLLGTTFPLISAAIVRRQPAHAGGVLAWCYASNSFGAAVGVLIAGFYLVGRFGLPGTLVVAAVVNLAAALVTAALVLQNRVLAAGGPAHAASRVAVTRDAGPAPRSLLLAVAFGTAVASSVYEIAWIRMLSLVLGSATHSFELMLSAFILGLSLGSLWVRRRADRFRDPLRALGLVQCAMGALAVATLPLYIASFGWTAALLVAFTKTLEGYIGFTVARYAICIIIMLPATFCAGITLPLITRTLYRSDTGERAIGEVYATNTTGSIVGVQLAGLVLMPALGLKLLLMAGAALDVVLGLALLYATARRPGASRRALAVAAGVTVLVFAAGSGAARFEPALLASGVFRSWTLPVAGASMTPFYRDGRTATVSVGRTALGDVTLATNGKPDASISAEWLSVDSSPRRQLPLTDDLATQVLLPLISLAHVPRAQTAAVIGQGSGMTSHILLGDPALREVVTVEIEPEMIRGSMAFYPLNRRVFDDPRARFVIDDAKSFFAAAGRRFDLIVSEPSNPWVSGVSGLFTAEFYRRVKRYLTPNGVFAQWLHLYESNDGLVRSVLAALQTSFTAYDVFMAGDADIVVIASAGTALPQPDWSVAALPAVQRDLARGLPLTPGTLDALRVANAQALRPFVTTARPNSDYAPVLDLGAERARFLGTDAAGVRALNVFSFDIGSALSGRRAPFSSEPYPSIEFPRLQLRSRGALLRGAPADERSLNDPLLEAALSRRRALDVLVSLRTAPQDWHEFVTTLGQVDRDVHGGSAGVVDSVLYGSVEPYLRAVKAPAAVRSAVAFLRALDAWDWPTAALAADALLAAERRGEAWISADYLRDGAVVAQLKSGDARGALRTFEFLLPRVHRDPMGTFRTRLLAAHLAIAQEAMVRKGTPPND